MYQPHNGGSPPMPGLPIGLPSGPPQPMYNAHPGYNSPPVLGQPISSPYQPQYYPPVGPPPQASYYPPPPGPPPQSSYYSPPGPPFGHSQFPAYSPQYPPHNVSTYPGSPHTSAQAPLWYLGTQIPNIFLPPGEQYVPGYDPTVDVEKIRNATKGLGTQDNILVSTLAPLSAMNMQALANRFMAARGKSLVSVLESETSFNFKFCLRALAMGPLAWDVYLLRFAMGGTGTKESVLTELLLGRPMPEINLLSQAYHHIEGRNLLVDVKGELSMKTERMFVMALSSQRPPDTTPIDYAQVTRDVDALYHAGEKKFGTDEMVFCDIFINRTQPHISAVCEEYPRKYKKYKSLSAVIKKEFSGHMKQALLHIYQGANPKHDRTGIYRDAKLIYKSMEGLGTQDNKLVWRVVRAHWDYVRFESVKAAYFKRRKTTLEHHIRKETSGSYRNLLLELTKSGLTIKH